MGSSAKKKKEKRKDFKKAKLKVGKAKPKPANYTDTSFKAKSIVLQKQSLSAAAPSSSTQFAHHASLLRSSSEAQRSESLAYLTNVIKTKATHAPLPEPIAVLLPKLQPLIVDGAPAVRQQLLRLFQVLPSEDVARQPEVLLLFIHAALTHLSAGIRSFGLEVLAWLTKSAGLEVVSCSGGWMKTLRCFTRQLGWEKAAGTNSWTALQGSALKSLTDRKAVVQQLMTLASFITAGIGRPASAVDLQGANSGIFPLIDVRHHLLPERSNAYGHLYLFGAPPDEDGAAYEDREDRQRLFAKHFRYAIEQGIDEIRKEGGELGRAAVTVSKAIEEGMSDFSG